MKKSSGWLIGILSSLIGIIVGFIGGAITVSLIGGDASHETQDSETDDFTEEKEEIAEIIALDEDKGESTTLDVSSLNNRYFNVRPDFSFDVVVNCSLDDAYHYISIFDSDKTDIPFTLSPFGERCYSVTPVTPYREGNFYFASLSNEQVYFFEKDESVREIVFNVDRNAENRIEINEELIHYINSSDVFDCLYSGKDGSFRTKNAHGLSVGTVFCVSSSNTVDRDSLLGEISSIEKEGQIYRVDFKNPPLEKVFTTLDVNKTEQVELDNVVFSNSESIKEEFKKTSYLKNLAKAITKVDNSKENKFWNVWGELVRNLKVDFSSSCPTKTSIHVEVVLKSKVGLNNDSLLEFQPKAYVFLKFLCSIDLELTVNADATIKRGLFGIPYGLNLNADVIQTTTTTWKATFSVGTRPNSNWPDSDYIAEKITDELENLDYLLNESKGNVDYKCEDPSTLKPTVDDGKYYIPIGKAKIYIFAFLDIQIDIGVEIEMSLDCEIGVTRRQTDTYLIGSYSTKDGAKSSQKPMASKSTSWDIALRGSAEMGVYVKASVSLALTGLRWLFELGIEFRVGFYFELTGVINVSIADSGQQGKVNVSINGGMRIEAGIKADVTIYAKLVIIKNEWPLGEWKIPLSAGITGSLYLAYIPTNENIFIDEDSLDLNGLGIFNVAKYEASNNSIVVSACDVFGSLIGDVSFEVAIVSGGDDLDISDEGVFIIKNEKSLRFDAQIEVLMKNGVLSTTFKKTYNIHFVSKDCCEVFFDGEVSYYRKGSYIELPALANTEEKEFKGWKIEGTERILESGSMYCVDEKVIYLTSAWEKCEYYTVNFFNRNNELISSQRVRSGYDAVPPCISKAAVEGYVFIGWDKDFHNITEDTDIHGVYVRSCH